MKIPQDNEWEHCHLDKSPIELFAAENNKDRKYIEYDLPI